MPPMPKRIEERRRANVYPGEAIVQREGAVEPPALPTRPRPHAVARAWYESLAESGQSDYFEPSDWAAAVYVVQVITRALRPGSTASAMATAWAMMNDLLTTEAARRRARLQVQRMVEGAADEKPSAIEEYRRRLGG